MMLLDSLISVSLQLPPPQVMRKMAAKEAAQVRMPANLPPTPAAAKPGSARVAAAAPKAGSQVRLWRVRVERGLESRLISRAWD